MLSVRAFLQGIFVLKVDQFTATARHRKVISIDFTGDGTDFTVELSSTGSEEQLRQLLARAFFHRFSLFTGLNPEDVDASTHRADHGHLTAAHVLSLVTSGLTAQLLEVIQVQAGWLDMVSRDGSAMELREGQVDYHSHSVVLNVSNEELGNIRAVGDVLAVVLDVVFDEEGFTVGVSVAGEHRRMARVFRIIFEFSLTRSVGVIHIKNVIGVKLEVADVS